MTGMSEKIRVSLLSEHTYAVEVVEGTVLTHHRVSVPGDLLDDLGLVDVDEQQLVHETIEFLLEREPSTSIYEEFPLDTVASHFPDYAEEIRTRLAS